MNVPPHSSAPTPSSSGARRREPIEPERRAQGVRGRFRRADRLLRHADFQHVYQHGRRHFGTHMTVFYLNRVDPAACSGARVGLTVGRALGGAVHRNRIKRRMRDAVRGALAVLTAPVDVVINPRKSAETVEFAVLRSEVSRAFAVIQGNETKARRKS